MESTPSPASGQPASAPEPEVLKPRADDGTPISTAAEATSTPINSAGDKKKRRTYRPSHKATFISLAVIGAILAINAAVLGFVLKNKSKSPAQSSGQVSISSDVLNKIGVNKNAVGSNGVTLNIDPDTNFNGKIQAAGDVNISGQLKLNSKFSSGEAAIAKLDAGNTSLGQLNVNGDSTLTTLNLRNALNVKGASQLQGAVTITELLTVSNNLNVTGNLAVGGTLSAGAFVARNLASTSTLTVGGHIISSGTAPAVGPGTGLGSNGTVGISGNDSAGTININIGVGASAGSLASVAFRTQFGNVPRIVISPVGVPGNFYITSPSIGGFGVAVASGLPPGGYAINYIVVQ